MNRQEIENLAGDELNTAVLLSLGAELICGSGATGVNWYLGNRLLPHKRYAWNIADAWELDKPGWQWSLEDCFYRLPGDIKVVRVRVKMPNYDHREGYAEWVNVEDKATACAIARCRAWLNACNAEAMPFEEEL